MWFPLENNERMPPVAGYPSKGCSKGTFFLRKFVRKARIQFVSRKVVLAILLMRMCSLARVSIDAVTHRHAQSLAYKVMPNEEVC